MVKSPGPAPSNGRRIHLAGTWGFPVPSMRAACGTRGSKMAITDDPRKATCRRCLAASDTSVMRVRVAKNEEA